MNGAKHGDKAPSNKAYDIADGTVATSIKSGVLAGVAVTRNRSALTGDDYDLAAGKAHGT